MSEVEQKQYFLLIIDTSMELGPIFIIGFIAALVSDAPDRHFRRIIPNDFAVLLFTLLLRFGGVAAMIGDFSISYLKGNATIGEYLLFSISPTIVWIWRSIDDFHELHRQARILSYALTGMACSIFCIIIGSSLAIHWVFETYK